MVDLPRIPIEHSVTDAPHSTISGSEITSAFNALASGLNQAFGKLEQVGAEDAAAEGQAAVYRDENGATRFTPRSSWSASGRSFNRAARTAALAQASSDARSRIAEMRIQAGGDIEKFKSLSSAFKNEMISRQDKLMLGPMKIMLDGEINQQLNGLREQQFRIDTAANEKAIRMEMESLNGEMAALAREGGTNTKEYLQKSSSMKTLMGELTGNPLFGVSKREADEQLKRIADAHTGEWIVGRVEDQYEAGGLPAASKFVEEELNNPELSLTPAEREKYKRQGRQYINGLKAKAAGEARQLRSEVAPVLYGLERGVPQDDAMLDDLVKQADAVDPGLAVRLRSARAHAFWKHDFADKPPREKAAELSSMLGADLPVVAGYQAGRVSGANLDRVNPQLLGIFKNVQNQFGSSVPIVSGFRDAATNAKAGGARQSQHLHGDAIDLDVSGLSKERRINLIEIASANGITGIGVYKNSLHFDLGPRRAWGPDHRYQSTPAWAASTIMKHLGGVNRQTVAGGVDGLFRSVVQAESGFDPGAVSYKGAAGMAQVMPGTARDIARELGDPNFPYGGNDEEVRAYLMQNGSERSLTYGRHYLDKMLKRYKGDAQAALVAYNAGPGVADKWLASGRDASLLPSETRAYVSKVMARRGGGDARQIVEARKGVLADLKANKEDIKKGLLKGLPIADEDMQFLAQQVALVGDDATRREISSWFGEDGLYAFPSDTPKGQEADLAAMLEGGISAGEVDEFEAKKQIHDNQQKMLAQGEALTLVGYNRSFHEPVRAIDTTTPESFAQSLADRQRAVDFAKSHFEVEVGAFKPAEAKSFTAQFNKMPAEAQGQYLLAMFQALPSETYIQTAAQIAGELAPSVRYAGGIMADDPDAAKEILQGTELLKANPSLAPKATAQNLTDMNAALPFQAFAPELQATLYKDMWEAARAIYATRTATTGDQSGELNNEVWKTAVARAGLRFQDVNGRQALVPDGVADLSAFISSELSEADINGAQDNHGRPIGLEDFRDGAVLEAVGNGKYWVRLTNAQSSRESDFLPYVMRNDGKAFVLDLTETGRSMRAQQYRRPPPVEADEIVKPVTEQLEPQFDPMGNATGVMGP